MTSRPVDSKPPARAPANVIDVWDCATFDAHLLGQLESDADLMLNYFQTDHRIFLEHDIPSHRCR
jgi:hypothetical protein